MRVLVAIALWSMTLVALACSESATPSPTPAPAVDLFPYTVTDGNGAEFTFQKPPERIVAFDSAVVETLFAIGEGHRVVATHDFVTHPPETANIPKVGDAFNMNIESIVALEPDLVFIFSDGGLADLQRAGLTVLYQKSLGADFRKVADNIRMWGGITGNPDAAEYAAATFDARVAKIEETMAAQGDGPSIFQDVGGLWTPGQDTLIAEVFELLKLENIASGISGYAQLSPEVIVAGDPEIIIALDPGSITGNQAFGNVKAVKDGRVFTLPSNALDVAGPRFVEGIEELARLAYPGLFN